MKTFSAVLLCMGTLSLAAAAPVARDSSPVEYEYDYDHSAQQQQQPAQEPQESASHYDAYIQDVKAAASGGNGGKKGFSQGSGLRTIAQGSANQAKTALGNQAAAGYQAAYVAKNTLAQSAAQASATAQAALAGKQVILSGLEQQVRDAKVGLQGEEMQLQQAKRAAQAAANAAQQAMHQVNVIQAALNAAQATSENANEAASQAAGELGAQTAMVGAARQRLHALQEQLHGVRIDFEATQAAARKAQAAAQQAQANAAAAAAKAAAAGLGGQKDSSHEEWASSDQDPIQVTSDQPLHIHEEPEQFIPEPEPSHAIIETIETNAFTPKPPSFSQSPHTKPNQIELDKSVEFQYQPFQSAVSQFTFKPISTKPAKLVAKQVNNYAANNVKLAVKPAIAKPTKVVAKPTQVVSKLTQLVSKPTQLVNKPTKVVLTKSKGNIFQDAYVNLDSFNKANSQTYAKQFGFYGW
ncbi:tol-Pal system protein TolA isoform X1 [Helicoverpa armigera]|uniref:tol-Pal system protein TolA isoform X1 n=1 Tax=Helicoverpa armigera TaxID=29058 RepID=UPI003082FD27